MNSCDKKWEMLVVQMKWFITYRVHIGTTMQGIDGPVALDTKVLARLHKTGNILQFSHRYGRFSVRSHVTCPIQHANQLTQHRAVLQWLMQVLCVAQRLFNDVFDPWWDALNLLGCVGGNRGWRRWWWAFHYDDSLTTGGDESTHCSCLCS